MDKLKQRTDSTNELLELMYQSILVLSTNRRTVKPVLETTCIKRPYALRDHCSDTTTLLKSI